MATMNISLPGQMKAWVESRAETGRNNNTNDNVRDLNHQDQQRAAAIAELDTLIQEGIDSGVSERSVEDIWNEA